jgi:hypothetical protein
VRGEPIGEIALGDDAVYRGPIGTDDSRTYALGPKLLGELQRRFVGPYRLDGPPLRFENIIYFHDFLPARRRAAACK